MPKHQPPKCAWCDAQIEYGGAAVSIDHHVDRFHRDGTASSSEVHWLAIVCGQCGHRLDLGTLREALRPPLPAREPRTDHPECGSRCMNVHCSRCNEHVAHDEGFAVITHCIQQFNHDRTISVIHADDLVYLCGDCSEDLDAEALGEDLRQGVHRLPEGPGIPDDRPAANTIWRTPVSA